MASLYIVSTPIGNKNDISLRALEVISRVDCLLCEDTRKTGMLLGGYLERKLISNKPQLVSFFEANEKSKIPEVIEWLKEGKEVGLVSNAGTPLISDPGFKLVRECVGQEIKVVSIPGASALLAGLVVSGLPINNFMFLGFLPKKQGKKEKLLEKVRQVNEVLPQTIVFYESPFRVVKSLELLDKIIPEAKIVIGRELTKRFEEIYRGTVNEVLDKFKEKKIKGELVVMMSW